MKLYKSKQKLQQTIEPPKLSQNKICKKYGLAPGTVSKRMTEKSERTGPTGRRCPERESL